MSLFLASDYFADDDFDGEVLPLLPSPEATQPSEDDGDNPVFTARWAALTDLAVPLPPLEVRKRKTAARPAEKAALLAALEEEEEEIDDEVRDTDFVTLGQSRMWPLSPPLRLPLRLQPPHLAARPAAARWQQRSPGPR